VQSKTSDHDFHAVIALTPSVTLVVDFDGDENIAEEKRILSFYRGNAHVCLKDSIFQLSNAEREREACCGIDLSFGKCNIKGLNFLPGYVCHDTWWSIVHTTIAGTSQFKRHGWTSF